MKTKICILHFPDRKRPFICIKQGDRCVPIAMVHQRCGEFFWNKILNGHNAIELDCDCTIQEIFD